VIAFLVQKTYIGNMDEKALFKRLDRIIVLLEASNRQPTIMITGVGIMGLISIIDVIKHG